MSVAYKLVFPDRMYNPEMGRFNTKDPIGSSAGDENLYRYVGNRPVTFTDPSRLDVTLYLAPPVLACTKGNFPSGIDTVEWSCNCGVMEGGVDQGNNCFKKL